MSNNWGGEKNPAYCNIYSHTFFPQCYSGQEKPEHMLFISYSFAFGFTAQSTAQTVRTRQ